MRKLLHLKANALQSICDLTNRVTEQLMHIADAEAYEAVIALLQARKEKMDEIDTINKRIHFLEESGYAPPNIEDIEAIKLEKSTIQVLLHKLKDMDEKNNQRVLAFRDQLSEELRDVKDGQKSIIAYASAADEEEGLQFDTLQ